MLRFEIIGHGPRAPPDRLRAILAWMKKDFLDAAEKEERCLEEMAHWHDPAEMRRIHHCRQHSLLDDNPTSG
jgi:hypothetical protein